MSIEWDERGVPIITANSDEEVCRLYGVAQAEAHAREILQLYGVARGHAARLWGEKFVADDIHHAQLGLENIIDEWCRSQEAQTWRRLEAFSEGINEACSNNLGLGAGRREVLPITARDVVSHSVKLFLTFARFWDEAEAFPPTPGGLLGGGSNGWAVSGDRSDTGNAFLLINPHIPWMAAFRLFEARTISPGRSCHGITTLGLPWQVMAYGQHAGWTHTVNPVPQWWVYALEVSEGTYRYDGELLAFVEREHTIDVRDGSPVRVLERRSVHGPVITAPDGVDVAIRVAGVLHQPAYTALEAWWQMSLAQNVGEVLAAQDRFPLPLFNIIAADSAGSIAAAYCGAAPRRPGGSFADSRRRRRGEDPAEVWSEIHPAGDLPRVIDPDCGWVQNVNETPWWFCEPPLDPELHPDGLAPGLNELRDVRSPVSRAHLRAKDVIDAEHLLKLKWSTRVALADAVLDDLVSAAAGETDLKQACQALQSWDRHANATSRGYPLFHLWAHEHFSLSALLIDPNYLTPSQIPGEMPTGLVETAAAVQSLRRAVETLTRAGYPVDVDHGTFHAIPAGPDGQSVPASGGPSFFGNLKCLEFAPQEVPRPAIGGDSWISLVEFTLEGSHASNLLLYSNTTEPAAVQTASQVEFFSRDQLLPCPPLPSWAPSGA